MGVTGSISGAPPAPDSCFCLGLKGASEPGLRPA
jgi:hypothetical protein